MSIPMRIRAVAKGDTVVVRALMFHYENTGLTVDPSGNRIPAHFIQQVICRHNDRVVLRCDWGIAISKNPYLEFHLKDAHVGDTITIGWLDNEGEHESGQTKVV